MDMVTILGLGVALVAILGGQMLEGGHIGSLVQLTAGLIVFGGTAGAVLISTTRDDLRMGLRLLRTAWTESDAREPEQVLKDLVEAAQIARKDSILTLEKRIEEFKNPFMKSVLRFVVDGVEPQMLRDIFETEIIQEEERMMAGAKIWTDAGGYAPTIGIIGAVLGLIHIMGSLSDTSKLGAGIAVAFVATIYGVASANIIFLPVASKIKRRIRLQTELKTMVLEGCISILNGMNPFLLEQKLKPFLHHPIAGGSVINRDAKPN